MGESTDWEYIVYSGRKTHHNNTREYGGTFSRRRVSHATNAAVKMPSVGFRPTQLQVTYQNPGTSKKPSLRSSPYQLDLLPAHGALLRQGVHLQPAVPAEAAVAAGQHHRGVVAIEADLARVLPRRPNVLVPTTAAVPETRNELLR